MSFYSDFLHIALSFWQQNGLCIVLIYLTAINVTTFFLYGIDKYKARKSKWRVRESTLIWLSVFGGSIGAWVGMRAWHHKTLHAKFKYGIPLILFAQIAGVVLVWYYLL